MAQPSAQQNPNPADEGLYAGLSHAQDSLEDKLISLVSQAEEAKIEYIPRHFRFNPVTVTIPEPSAHGEQHKVFIFILKTTFPLNSSYSIASGEK